MSSIKRVFGNWAFAPAVIFLLLFLVLREIARRLPSPRGSAFRLRDELVRYGAVASCLLGVLLLLAVFLPLLFDFLERRAFGYYVATRHVRASKSGFLTVISLLSICGVALGSCALCSVTSVMGGFGQDLKRKILGSTSHINIDTQDIAGFGEYREMLDRVRLVPGVVAATPVVRGEGMASSVSSTAGAAIRGIDPESIGGVIDLVKNIEVGKLEYLEHPDRLMSLPPDEVVGMGPGGEPYLKGPDLSPRRANIDPSVRDALPEPPASPGIAVGREFARTIHAYVGDEITLVSPLGDLGPMGVLPRSRKFRIAAIFYSGMYEYDATHVYMTLETAQRFFSMDDHVSAIEVKTVDYERAGELLGALRRAVGRDDLRLADWRELNKNLFSALKLEKAFTFGILSIAILVASFCIICTLLLMVTEKGKEIAILKAIGASDGAILRVFLTEGIIIGSIGTVYGVVTALVLCVGLSRFGVRLDPEVYYIDRLPIAVSWSDYVAVAVAAVLICTISTLYPARAASRLRPVDGLRYE